jgi:hypothetical protein
MLLFKVTKLHSYWISDSIDLTTVPVVNFRKFVAPYKTRATAVEYRTFRQSSATLVGCQIHLPEPTN